MCVCCCLLIGCFSAPVDDVSAGSSTEFPDRLSLMEARLQTQEDEMTLLKSALSDALRRLRVYDEQIPLLRQHILAGSSGSRRGTYSQGLSIKMFIRGRPITMYIPSNIQNYEELRMEPPTERLELDWVYPLVGGYGYRGRDCRSNLYLLPSGEVVYFIACVVVLYHIDARTQRHYLKHTDCVRCLAVHPDQVRVATGQTSGVDKDGKPLQPFVMIWDSGTLVTLQQIGLGCFERGVSSVAFSQIDSGAFLCVIDDSNEHMMSVWDWAKGVKQAEIKQRHAQLDCKNEEPTPGLRYIRIRSIARGDITRETFQIVRQTKAHEGSIFTLCLLQGGALLSGGGKDRRVVRWSADLAPEIEVEIPEQFGAVRTIAEVKGEELLIGTTRNAILKGSFSDGFVPIVQGHVDELWGLATHPFDNVFLSCGHDKQVCLWSGSQHSLEWSTTLEETGLCADFHPNGRVVGVGLNTGRSTVNCGIAARVWLEGSDGTDINALCRSHNERVVAVADDFCKVHLFQYPCPKPKAPSHRYDGHGSHVTNVRFTHNDSHLISMGGKDTSILQWRVMRVGLDRSRSVSSASISSVETGSCG
ncbi:UNVERIFIED_CONTAM: hypothetical protein FKN15_015869 [Acipenser sinensis]